MRTLDLRLAGLDRVSYRILPASRLCVGEGVVEGGASQHWLIEAYNANDRGQIVLTGSHWSWQGSQLLFQASGER